MTDDSKFLRTNRKTEGIEYKVEKGKIKWWDGEGGEREIYIKVGRLQPLLQPKKYTEEYYNNSYNNHGIKLNCAIILLISL